MTNEELPLLSEVIEAYEKGQIKPFEGYIRCRPFKEHSGLFWIPYEEIVNSSIAFKEFEKIEMELMWSKK